MDVSAIQNLCSKCVCKASTLYKYHIELYSICRNIFKSAESLSAHFSYGFSKTTQRTLIIHLNDAPAQQDPYYMQMSKSCYYKGEYDITAIFIRITKWKGKLDFSNCTQANPDFYLNEHMIATWMDVTRPDIILTEVLLPF